MNDDAPDKSDRLTPEQQRMVSDHLYIARVVVQRCAMGVGADERKELEQAALEAISEAAFGYDADLGTFRAYAWRAAYHRVVQHVRRAAWHRRAFRLATGCLSHQRTTIDFFAAAPPLRDELQRLARRAASAFLLGMAGPTEVDSPTEEAVLARRRLELIQDALGQLPGEQRVVLVAHYFEERTFRALSEDLGVSYSTVRRRHDRGLDGLRERLLQLQEGP